MDRDSIRPGDIVQVNPNCSHGREYPWFDGCLIVITEVYAWGVQGYVKMPGPNVGVAYVRLATGEFEPTGGRVVWVIGSEENKV